MEHKTLNLQFPMGGVSRKFGFRKPQEKYTAPDAVNVIGDSKPGARLRGGSRPGISIISDTGVINAKAACVVPSGLLVVGSPGSGRPVAFLEGSEIDVPSSNEIMTEEGSVIVDDSGDALAASVEGIGNCDGLTGASMIYHGGKIYVEDGDYFSVFDISSGKIEKKITLNVPSGKKILAVWKERLVVAGNDGMVYFSRQGDFGDFDLSGDGSDVSRAVAFVVDSTRKDYGHSVTALCNIEDRYLLIFTSDEVFQLSGILCQDHVMRRLTGGNGAFCPASVCPDFSGGAMFAGHNGIWRYSGYEGGSVLNISGASLPALSSYDEGKEVLAAFDEKLNGYLFFFKTDGKVIFYSLSDEAFWPFSIPEMPAGAVSALCGGRIRRPLLVFSDGRVARFDWDADTDFGIPILSKVILGPFFGDGSDLRDSILLEVQGTLGSDSGNVTWGSFTRQSAEDSAQAAMSYLEGSGSPDASGVWKADRNSVDRCRVRGNWTSIVLSSSSPWSYGAVTAKVGILGRIRYGCSDR